MASTFGTYNMARLGIYVSSQAIRVTGNNITNINTDGYTRQTLDQVQLSMSGSEKYYNPSDPKLGMGVIAPSASHARDEYLDIRYRNENSNVGYMETKLNGLDQLSSMMDEVNKGDDGAGVLESMLNDAIAQMSQLATSGAGDKLDDTLFRSSMNSVVRQLNKTSDALSELAQNLRSTITDDVQEVNDILDRIRVLNNGIRKSEIYGDTALDMEDERNNLLDELSKFMRIDVSYTTEKVAGAAGKEVQKLTVRTATTPQRLLIEGNYVANLRERKNSEYYDLDITDLTNLRGENPLVREADTGPILDNDLGAVLDGAGFALQFSDDRLAQDEADERNAELAETRARVEAGEELATTDLNTEYRVVEGADGRYEVHQFGVTNYNSGQEAQEAINQMLLDTSKHVNEATGEVLQNSYRVLEVNGHFEVHIFDTFRGETQTGDTEFGGILLADREMLTEKGVFSTEEDIARDANAGGKRGIPFYQKALDTLAAHLADTLNEANTIPDEDLFLRSGVNFVNEAGRIVTGDRERYVLKAEYADYTGGPLISNSSVGNDTEGINASNISLSADWLSGDVRVVNSKQPNAPSKMNDNLDHIYNLLNDPHTFYVTRETAEGEEEESGDEAEPAAFFTGSYQELFTGHIALTLADDSRTTSMLLDNYSLSADDLYVSRDGVQGVDLNDEAMDLMRFQQSYSAACRLMTTFDEMLERLINGTAM